MMTNFLTWLLNDFATELLAAELLFSGVFIRRKHFIVQAVVSLLLYFPLCYFSMNFSDIVLHSGWPYFPTVLFLSCAALAVPFEISPRELVYIAFASYSIQNVAFNLNRMLLILLPVGDLSVGEGIIHLVTFTGFYTVAYFLFVRRMRNSGSIQIGSTSQLLVAAAVIFLSYALNLWVMDYGLDEQILVRISLMANSFLILALQCGLFQQTQMERDAEMLRQLMYKEQNHYKFAKENIDLMNLKSHDLKHQISALRRMEEEGREEILRETEKLMEAYDQIVKTENEPLNVVLTEKSFFCNQHSIDFLYTVDGSALNLMDPIDVYTLFGNALDNAIEAVMLEPDKTRRIIRMECKKQGDFVFVKIENYCPLPPKIINNTVISSKRDADRHGFGLKSIRYIVEKYKGTFSFKENDNLFTLTLLFSLPQKGLM